MKMSIGQYRRRLQRSGNTLQESVINNTTQSANRLFENSPFSQEVLINDAPFEAIVTQGKTNEDKTMLLQSSNSANIGDIVEINTKSYLMLDFKNEGINDIYPTGTLKLCNSTFPIQTDKISVLIGHDEFGRPVYDEQIITENVPCIVESRYSFTRGEHQISLPDSRIEVMLKYYNSETLKLGKEITVYSDPYEIKNIDYTKVINGKGIVVLSAERVVSNNA
jgi:hypothetical protein